MASESKTKNDTGTEVITMSVSYVQVRDDLLKLLAGEIIREVIGSSNYEPKIGKVEKQLIEKIGLESLERFKKSLAKTSRRGSDANGAWNTFVKTIEGVKHERTGSQRSLKLKITSVERKKAIEISKTTEILKDLSVFDYRMAILCEAFKTAIDSEDSSINHKGLGGNNVLHFSSALPTDASNRQKFNLELIEFLVNNNLDLCMTNDKSMTALHIIIGNYVLDPRKDFDPVAVLGSFDCTTSIIERYKLLCCFSLNRPFNVRGPHGNSILHEWAIRGSICGYGKNDQRIEEEARIGQWIITSANVSPNKTNDYGCTALHYAFRDHLARVLCENGADKEGRNEFGETPLICRLKHSFLRGFVHEVLPQEWDLETTLINRLGIKRNDEDMNLKRIVAFHTISLEMLAESLENLERLEFDLKERDKLNQDKDCLDYLLCILRDCLCEGCKEETGQHFKTLKCLLDCVTRLIENGAVLCGEKTGSKAPLYLILLVYCEALDMLHDEIKTKILECVEKMLESGADPNNRDSNGNTVLHLCCQKVDPSDKQQKELVQLICEYGADPKDKDNTRVSATQILEKRGGKCTELARYIESLKPKLRVKVDLKSKRYEKALDNLCRRENPNGVGAFRYDPEYIGKGAMSYIYLAIDENSKREVALKRILKANNQKELQSEIKSLVALDQNSNVIKYYCLEEDSNFHYIAIELMEGDLSYLVKEYDTLGLSQDEETTIKLATDIVEGLTFLHQSNILHRDLKPGNILFRLNPELCLKLADFGLSKHLTPSVNQSSVLGSTSSSLTGTRGWMAPELVRREVQSHCQKTDMFALGLVLHFLISKGFHPFDQSKTPLYIVISNGTLKPHELETSICSGNPKHLWQDLTPEAKHLILLLLSNVPSQRPLSKNLLKCSCYFWSKLKKVEFMEAVGNQIEIAKPSSQDHYLVVSKFEYSTFGKKVRKNPWNVKLSDLSNELYARRPYDAKTVIDLIRFFRNAYAHYEERSPTCKVQLLNDIFFAEFPDFFLTVFTVVNELGWLKSNSGRDWLLRVLNEKR